MNANQIEAKFAGMGARFKVRPKHLGSDFAIDIQHDREGEFFEFRRQERVRYSLDLMVLQVDVRDRHLLLLVRRDGDQKERFLCGHDEREWFVAAVPGTASTVRQAKDALQPRLVREALRSVQVPARKRHARKNEAFRRQGEWFFVPVSQWRRRPINEKFILRNEPIRRGGGKPHMVEEVYRDGGERVYVSGERPNGLSEREYRRLLLDRPAARKWRWTVMRRNSFVYARGAVRHPDHATIYLPDWHEVAMNTETETPSMRNVAFLD